MLIHMRTHTHTRVHKHTHTHTHTHTHSHTHTYTHTYMMHAAAELKRVRDANGKYDASAKEYKETCAKLEHELVSAGRISQKSVISNGVISNRKDTTALTFENPAGERSAELSKTVEDCKKMLEEASLIHAEKLHNNDTAWQVSFLFSPPSTLLLLLISCCCYY
jgi:hypothetical protein